MHLQTALYAFSTQVIEVSFKPDPIKGLPLRIHQLLCLLYVKHKRIRGPDTPLWLSLQKTAAFPTNFALSFPIHQHSMFTMFCGEGVEGLMGLSLDESL